jgi:outer membrane protein assembly factor BamE
MTSVVIANYRPNYRPWAALSGLRRLAVAALVLALLAGCVHRIDIQQGNFLDTEDIDRIAVGMTRVQVRALLGTPMVADPFQGSRWDYVYYLKKGRWQKAQQRHFVVYFDSADKVAKIERPAQSPKS